jgi:NAD(P)-dependent dehydrogenase (short-subunit alcohol dehydrogenase family)
VPAGVPEPDTGAGDGRAGSEQNAGMSWTTADMPDQTGRTAIVTGANSGLGYHTALELTRRGARVVLACRDPERGADALRRLCAEVATASVELGVLDLADLASVRRFAEAHRTGGLDLLVNNAGVMALPLRRTADGFEMQFGTNHLGHFALTGLLLPALLARPGARVVTVSSGLHKIGRIDFDNLNAERRYRRWRAYGQSKLANLLFTLELQRRADAAGAALLAAAAHPGFAATNLQTGNIRMTGRRRTEPLVRLGNRLFSQSDAAGALPSLFAATDPTVGGADYIGPDGPFEQRGHPERVSPSRRARDTATATRLWTVSEDLTGVHYDALTA